MTKLKTAVARRAAPEQQNLADPADLARELARERGLDAARRDHDLTRVRAAAAHGRARADVAQETRLAELARAEREAEAAADAELAQLYRQYRAAGERTRIAAQMARSGEARALRLEHLRRLNVRLLVPVLIGFGVWSTTGVQQGASRLMAVTPHSPIWWTLWGLEALLISVVCWIIVARARLATSGGRLSHTAEKVGATCLSVSIVLNLIAAVPAGDAIRALNSWWSVPGSMFAHAIGPVGAAVVAHLIGSIDRSISDADPWHDRDGLPVPRLTDMDLHLPAPNTETRPHDPPSHDRSPAREGSTPRTDTRTGGPQLPHGASPQTRTTARTTSRTDEPHARTEARRKQPQEPHDATPQSRRAVDTDAGNPRSPRRERISAGVSPTTPIDRDELVNELAREMLAARTDGSKWKPNYPELRKITKRSQRWCEYLVREARNLYATLADEPSADSPQNLQSAGTRDETRGPKLPQEVPHAPAETRADTAPGTDPTPAPAKDVPADSKEDAADKRFAAARKKAP